MGADAVDTLLQTLAGAGVRGLRLAAGSPARMLDAAGTAQTMSGAALTR